MIEDIFCIVSFAFVFTGLTSMIIGIFQNADVIDNKN